MTTSTTPAPRTLTLRALALRGAPALLAAAALTAAPVVTAAARAEAGPLPAGASQVVGAARALDPTAVPDGLTVDRRVADPRLTLRPIDPRLTLSPRPTLTLSPRPTLTVPPLRTPGEETPEVTTPGTSGGCDCVDESVPEGDTPAGTCGRSSGTECTVVVTDPAFTG